MWLLEGRRGRDVCLMCFDASTIPSADLLHLFGPPVSVTNFSEYYLQIKDRGEKQKYKARSLDTRVQNARTLELGISKAVDIPTCLTLVGTENKLIASMLMAAVLPNMVVKHVAVYI